MIAVVETRLEQPFDTPGRFVLEFGCQFAEDGILPDQIEVAHQRVASESGAVESLRQVAGVMPAAIDDLPLVFVESLPVLVADAVDVGNRVATALTVV